MTFLNNNLLFVSNIGYGMYTTPTFDFLGKVESLSNAMIFPINVEEELTDIEEVTSGDGVSCFISHESTKIGGENYISFYKNCDLYQGIGTYIKLPEEISMLPKNQGIEALAISNNGNIVAIEEFGLDKIYHRMWIWNIRNQDYALKTLLYQTDYYVGVSSATFLQDNSLLIVERKTINSLNKLDKTDYQITVNQILSSELYESSGYIVTKQEIIALKNDGKNIASLSENIEAITIKSDLAKVDIFLLSDDQSLNRTVFLQFEFTFDNCGINLNGTKTSIIHDEI
ncbi:hypothetical protein SZ25_00414 [Candidatus Arcanobacter lacustris]|uniref:Phytase-like domain-containing protein n=1 Tax=Candidatus Arcanibacter lacustris TaxID=1607817 RepID=A0A0F5MPJ4_9RICK|nr:hypothetical protein SZ25_00849 [Candidatus Arcanobacter lacustris]KKB96494.1 hypothetical protein SZ25_00414 [Candidatus Arcanobacter lacustris]